MKAVIQHRYGTEEVLELSDVDMPRLGDAEVLVAVRAAALHPGDWFNTTGVPYVLRVLGGGLRAPRKRIPGFDLAGRIEAVGSDVTGFQPGEEVFGSGNGTCAEYVAAPARALAPKPAGLSMEQAAGIAVSGVTALRALRDKAEVGSGSRVLINGASGGVGTFAVQIARHLGAEVTGVCSTANVELVESLGAHRVIDYTREDFTRGGPRYDVILDNAGKQSLAAMRRALAPGGILLPNSGTTGGRVLGGVGRAIAAFAASLFIRRQGRPFLAVPSRDDLDTLTGLIESGAVVPVIDRIYSLADARLAMAAAGDAHGRGKVVVTI